MRYEILRPHQTGYQVGKSSIFATRINGRKRDFYLLQNLTRCGILRPASLPHPEISVAKMKVLLYIACFQTVKD